MSAETDIAVMKTMMDGHIKQDDERFARIDRGITKIEDMLIAQLAKLDDQAKRIHTRIDHAEETAREDTQSAITIARGESKVAISLATDANQAVLGIKIWVLTGAVSGLLALLAAAVTFVKAH